MVVLSTAADAVGLSRKLAQNKVVYYDKSKCKQGEASWNFQTGAFNCDKGHIACCGPESDKCYAAAGSEKFKCRTGDDINNCCTV